MSTFSPDPVPLFFQCFNGLLDSSSAALLVLAEIDDPANLRRPHSLESLNPRIPLFQSDLQPGHKVSEQSEDESPTARESRNLEVLNCFLTGSCLHFPIL